MDRSGSRRPRRRAVGTTIGAAALMALGAATPALAAPARGHAARASHALAIRTISNPRPQLISGERALLAITVPRRVARTRVDVKVGSRDVRDQFRRAPDGTLRGLVTGLRIGRNVVAARITGGGVHGGERARLVITDNPITGPVLSG